jgi:hypothetical protein
MQFIKLIGFALLWIGVGVQLCSTIIGYRTLRRVRRKRL